MKNYQLDLFIDYFSLIQPRDIVAEALQLLTQDFKGQRIDLNSSEAVKHYCRLKLAAKEHEIFGALFLDNQNRLIEYSELFRGSIKSCNIYIREVAKEALALNSAAVIFTHNHPSGLCEPSRADLHMTKELKDALSVFDIRVLDHIIVSLEGTFSIAEHGDIF